MGLKNDIQKALMKSLGPDAVGEGNVPEVAQDLTDAIIKFLKKQSFRITEMRAILELEKFQTSSDLQADVLTNVSVTTTNITGTPSGGGGIIPGTGSGKGNVTSGKRGVKVPKLNFRGGQSKEKSPQGGVLTARGHAYIGSNPVVSGETNVRNTIVKLLDEDIVDK